MSEDKSTRHAVLLASLREEVGRLTNSEGWQTWLRAAARFRMYSLHNQLLILSQRPDATRVTGYRTWQAIGRQVRRGERGIAILAPLTRTIADEKGDELRKVLTGFRIVHVFDVSQTEGAPLPEIELPPVGLDDEALLGRLLEASSRAGVEVKWLPRDDTRLGGARGLYDGEGRSITLASDHPIASQARTLVHELAHFCDHAANEWQFIGGRSICEIVAESATYLVGSGLGIELQDASTVYVASWVNDDGHASELEKVAERVLAVASRLDRLVAPALIAVPAA